MVGDLLVPTGVVGDVALMSLHFWWDAVFSSLFFWRTALLCPVIGLPSGRMCSVGSSAQQGSCSQLVGRRCGSVGGVAVSL